MKRRIIQVLLVVLLMGCCFLSAIWERQAGESSDSGGDEDPVYELAVLAPVTGDLSYIGEPVAWVMEYVQEAINEAGGINDTPIEITVYDTEFDTGRVMEILEEIAQDQRIILGPVDAPGTEAAAAYISEMGIPNIATYSYSSIREDTEPYGISYMSDSLEGEQMALEEWHELNPEISDVVILANPEDSAQVEVAAELASKLGDYGMNLLDIIYLDMEENDGLQGVVQALNAKADGYISLLRAGEHALLVTELRKRGIDEGWRITASFSAYESDLFEENADALSDTYIWNQFDVNYEGEEWQTLLAAYREDHDGSSPDTVAVAEMYNAVMAYTQCIAELGLEANAEDLDAERQQIAEWFYNSPVLEGIQGTYQWVNGKKIASFYYFQLTEDGAAELVDSTE